MCRCVLVWLLGCCFGAFFPSGADYSALAPFLLSFFPGIFTSCCKGSAITRGSWWHDTGHLDAIADDGGKGEEQEAAPDDGLTDFDRQLAALGIHRPESKEEDHKKKGGDV